MYRRTNRDTIQLRMKKTSLLLLILAVAVLSGCFTKGEDLLIRVEVENAVERLAVCNDGTPAIYFIREGQKTNKDKWIIFFEEGETCSDFETCMERWTNDQDKMTSNNTPNSLKLNGVFSSSAEENPDYYDYNHVFLSYCTSDGWWGDEQIDFIAESTLQLRGVKVVTAIFEDLKEFHNLGNAEEIKIKAGLNNGSTKYLDQIQEWYPDASVEIISQ